MRTPRTKTIGTMGLTALFGLAQVGAAVFLLQRFDSYPTFGSLARVLLVGLAVLLAAAEMVAAMGDAKHD